MALVTLSPGNYVVPYLGTSALRLDALADFVAGHFDVYAVAANRLGYTLNAGGSTQQFAAFPSFVPAVPGAAPTGYLFRVGAAFGLDATLFGAAVPGANPVRLYAMFPAGATTTVLITLTQADQPGTYLVDTATPGTGLTALTYARNGTAVTVTTATALVLVAGDVLAVTATTTAGAAGLLAFLKQ